MKRFFLFSFLLVFLISPLFVFGSGFVFEKNLKQGDKSSDVTELQKILNSSPDTQISASGTGSPGNETNYFGGLTKVAVIKFQNKYKGDILTPAGLFYGNGFVGGLTRGKLNNLDVKTTVSQQKTVSPIFSTTEKKAEIKPFFQDINPSEKKETSGFFGGIFGQNNESLSISSEYSFLDKKILSTLPSFITDVRVYGVDPYQVKPGQKVIISGVGFTEKQNSFSFGGVDTGDVDCAYSTYCEVVVPETAPLGVQVVSLKNYKGSSVGSQYSAKVYITQKPVSSAILSSITPDSIDLSSSYSNTTLVIKGEGFSSAENYIYTPLGKSGPYNSDGKTITFTFGDLKNTGDIIKNGFSVKAASLDLPMRVENNKGFSNIVSIKLLFKK